MVFKRENGLNCSQRKWNVEEKSPFQHRNKNKNNLQL